MDNETGKNPITIIWVSRNQCAVRNNTYSRIHQAQNKISASIKHQRQTDVCVCVCSVYRGKSTHI